MATSSLLISFGLGNPGGTLLSAPALDSSVPQSQSASSSSSSSSSSCCHNLHSNNNNNNASMFEAAGGEPNLPLVSSSIARGEDVLPLELLGTPVAQLLGAEDGSGGSAAAAATTAILVQDLSILPPQLSTPTMHPNLVSTLKSIISPLVSEEAERRGCDGDGGGPCTALGLRRQQEMLSYDDAPPPSETLSVQQMHHLQKQQQQQGSSAFPSPSSRHAERHAAIVPVDLIRNRRPFKCAFNGCNKTFKNPQTLKMHRKTHCSSSSHGIKAGEFHALATVPPTCKAGQNKKIPSRCPVCKRSFVGLYELRRHFGRKHSEGEKAHACSKCSKRFYIEVDLRDHEKLCGEPLQCKCGIKFAFKCNLVAHKKTHPACQDPPPQPAAPSTTDLLPSAPLLYPPSCAMPQSLVTQHHHQHHASTSPSLPSSSSSTSCWMAMAVSPSALAASTPAAAAAPPPPPAVPVPVPLPLWSILGTAPPIV